MQAYGISLHPFQSNDDIRRSREFLTEICEADTGAAKSPTVKRYQALFSSLVTLRRIYTHEGFRPSLLLEEETGRMVGIGSVALKKTIFHPAEGQMTGAELDYVIQPSADDDQQHIETIDLLRDYQNELNRNGDTNRARQYACFSSLSSTDAYQPRGVLLSDRFYEMHGAGHVEIEPDACLVAKNNAILTVYHSR